jgi:hypothetical protein
MLTQLAPFYVAGAAIAVAMFFAAMAAEGRGAHILRIILTHGRTEAVQTLREEALTGDVARDVNSLNLIAQLGAAERRYTELDARRSRAEEREAA